MIVFVRSCKSPVKATMEAAQYNCRPSHADLPCGCCSILSCPCIVNQCSNCRCTFPTRQPTEIRYPQKSLEPFFLTKALSIFRPLGNWISISYHPIRSSSFLHLVFAECENRPSLKMWVLDPHFGRFRTIGFLSRFRDLAQKRVPIRPSRMPGVFRLVCGDHQNAVRYLFVMANKKS